MVQRPGLRPGRFFVFFGFFFLYLSRPFTKRFIVNASRGLANPNILLDLFFFFGTLLVCSSQEELK